MPDDYYVSQYSGEEIDALLASAGVPIGITKEYQSVTEMNQDFTGTDVQRGQFVLILTTDTSSEDYGKVYLKGTANWVYVFTLTSLTAIKGPQGPAGKQGPAGSNFTILGYFDTLAALQAAVPNPKAGDAYGVGTAAPYNIYIWDSVHSKWVNNGNLHGNAYFFITEIPKGRMRGDVDGDGKLTQTDADQISQHMAGNITLTGADLWCADTNGNNSVNGIDRSQLNKYIMKQSSNLTAKPTFADYYNNWTYHKVDDTSGYWTTELSIPAITADTEGSIVWSGTGFAGTFIKAEPFAGGVRIYANYPPIEALPCEISYHTGAGGQFIIANTGVSEAGAKYAAVILTASGWSEGKQQTISVPGLKEDAMQQLIVPTQPSTDIEKYHSAGIRISARGDNTVTFSCETIPTTDVLVHLVIIPIIGRF